MSYEILDSEEFVFCRYTMTVKAYSATLFGELVAAGEQDATDAAG